MDSAKIFIDTDNEITFILEKILTSRSERVCLVVPDRAAVFTSISGLKLIKRIVEKSNKSLILVTLDANGADLAKKAGLHVVSRVGEIAESLWEEVNKSKFEVIKKDKKKVFYLPETQAKTTEPATEALKSKEEAPKKSEKINLSEIYKSTFESGDSSIVVGDVSELPIEEEKVDVPQIRIKVEDKEIKKVEEVIESPKKENPEEKVKFLQKAEESKPVIPTENTEKKIPPPDTARKRRSKEDTMSQLSFNEGEDLKSQKKNPTKLKKFVPVIDSGTLQKGKTLLNDAKEKTFEFTSDLVSKIKRLKDKNLSDFKPNSTKRRPIGRNRGFSSLNGFGMSPTNQLRPSSKNNSGNSRFHLTGKKKVLFYIGSLILVPLLIIGFIAYIFLNSTSLYSIEISYQFKNMSDERDIVADAGGTSGFKVTKLTETDSTSTSANTSGEKVTGDKAAGYLSVFNATSGVVVIKKGTAITCISTACNGLVYYPDVDLNLGPGSSANDFHVIAGDIGINYNLAVNSGRFKVGNYNANTDIIASNIQPITGGTAKNTLKVVSAADIKSVEEKAMADLKANLLLKIKNNPNNSQEYIFSDSSFVSEKVSAETDKEGTESDIINTNVTAKGTIDAFPKKDIQPVLDEMKSKLAPEGYYLDEKFFTSSTSIIPSEAGKITIKVQVGGIVRPNIEEDQIKADLKGKNLDEAEKYLKSIPNTVSHTTTFTPTSLPVWLRHVPSDPDRIQISLTALSPEE